MFRKKYYKKETNLSVYRAIASTEGIVSGRKLGRDKTETQDQAYQAAAQKQTFHCLFNFHLNISNFIQLLQQFFLTTENYEKQNMMTLHELLNGAVHFWQQHNIPHPATAGQKMFTVTCMS